MHIAIAKLQSKSPYSQSKNIDKETHPEKSKEGKDDYENRCWRARMHVTPVKMSARRLQIQVPGKGKTHTRFTRGAFALAAVLAVFFTTRTAHAIYLVCCASSWGEDCQTQIVNAGQHCSFPSGNTVGIEIVPGIAYNPAVGGQSVPATLSEHQSPAGFCLDSGPPCYNVTANVALSVVGAIGGTLTWAAPVYNDSGVYACFGEVACPIYYPPESYTVEAWPIYLSLNGGSGPYYCCNFLGPGTKGASTSTFNLSYIELGPAPVMSLAIGNIMGAIPEVQACISPTCAANQCGTIVDTNCTGNTITCPACAAGAECPIPSGQTTGTCCTPITSCPANVCGAIADGCGGLFECGMRYCPFPNEEGCNASNQCTLNDCSSGGQQLCGSIKDGSGVTTNCGTCSAAGYTCQSNKCFPPGVNGGTAPAPAMGGGKWYVALAFSLFGVGLVAARRTNKRSF